MAANKTFYVTKEIEPLIYDGISQILSRPGNDHSQRDFGKRPLSHDEQLFIITCLHRELADPKLPDGLIFLYGRILDFVASQILYN